MNNIIDNINYNAYLYQQSILKQFEEICAPLFHLGIKSFDYLKIFEDGRYLRLINNLEYSKQYLANIKDNGAFFTEQISEVIKNKFHYCLLEDIKKFNKKKNPILHMLYDFNMWNSFAIYKKNDQNYMEIYTFQMTREDTGFSQFYLNNLGLLERFCDYFNDRARDIIDCSDQRKLACFDQQFDFNTTAKEDLKAKKIQQFLQETQIKKRALSGSHPFLSSAEIDGIQYLALGKSVKEISSDLELPSYLIENSFQSFKGLNKREEPTKSPLALQSLQQFLSPRQKECLFLLTRGKTAKQTARLLGIDYRTVQTHIDLLKGKLNCHSKEQLIEKAFESGFAYVVPQSFR